VRGFGTPRILRKIRVTAYVIVDIEVTDPAGYEEYKQLAAPTVAAHGGRYVVRGGAAETLEGDWVPWRLVVLEFENVEQARRWWSSPEYTAARAVRQRTARTNMVVVAGL
jgi:uncharacterized protein (DUF1330 family)